MDSGQGSLEYLLLLGLAVAVSGAVITAYLYFGNDASAEVNRHFNEVPGNLTVIVCGNGVLEQGEECEVGDFDGQTCITQGFSGGDLQCNFHCEFDTSLCT